MPGARSAPLPVTGACRRPDSAPVTCSRLGADRHGARRPGRARPSARWLLLLATLGAPAPAAAGLGVVATTPDYGALARAVGGAAVEVTVLAKPTEDPHFVDARPSHVVTLHRADVLIESGAGLETGWLPPLVEGARNVKVQPGALGRILGSDGIQLLDVPATLDRSQGDVHGQGNPHFLMDPLNARAVAGRMAEAFCALDPGSCTAYRTNLSRFQTALDERMKLWTARLAPFRGRDLVTYHNTWRYFGTRFGLVTDTFLEPKPGIPPSPPHLEHVIGKMKAAAMRVVLVEPYQSRKTAEVVAAHAGATVVDVCQFPGGLPASDDDYLALIGANVEAIARGLAGGP